MMTWMMMMMMMMMTGIFTYGTNPIGIRSVGIPCAHHD